jgi:hypothetical protein
VGEKQRDENVDNKEKKGRRYKEVVAIGEL